MNEGLSSELNPAKRGVIPLSKNKATRNEANKYLHNLVYGDIDFNSDVEAKRTLSQKEGVSEIQEGDFQITNSSLRSVFVGIDERLRPTSEKILTESPEIKITPRKKSTKVIRVIADKESLNIYFQKMQATGIERRDENVLEVQKNDFPIIQKFLRETFMGSSEKLKPIVDEVLEENPEITVMNRISGAVHIKVIPDKKSLELFKRKMQEENVRLRQKNILEIQTNDFQIREVTVSAFVGDSDKLDPITKKVLEENPEITVNRIKYDKNKRGKVIRVIEEKESLNIYFQKMQEQGVKLRDKSIQETQETDFQLTQHFRSSTFLGNNTRLKLTEEDVFRQNPEIKITTRRRGAATIRVIADENSRRVFLEKMQEAGVKLRATKPLDDESKDTTKTDSYLNKLVSREEEVKHGDKQ